jgi:hypothetical protein
VIPSRPIIVATGGGEPGEVLDPVHARRQGVLHAEQRMGVRHHREASSVGGFDERGEFHDGELGAQLVGFRRREPA